VTVGTGNATLEVQIADDGIGGADETRGSGLRGLVDRVAVVDGTLTIDSPPGGGTRLTCTIPWAFDGDGGAGSDARAQAAAVLEVAR